MTLPVNTVSFLGAGSLGSAATVAFFNGLLRARLLLGSVKVSLLVRRASYFLGLCLRAGLVEHFFALADLGSGRGVCIKGKVG